MAIEVGGILLEGLHSKDFEAVVVTLAGGQVMTNILLVLHMVSADNVWGADRNRMAEEQARTVGAVGKTPPVEDLRRQMVAVKVDYELSYDKGHVVGRVCRSHLVHENAYLVVPLGTQQK